MRSTDRILVLAKVDPKSKNTGMIDPDVFEGKNNMHAVMDEHTCLWSIRYERGLPPAPLRSKYTSFKALKDEAEYYLGTKNIKIVEVQD